MKLWTLMENTACQDGFCAEHGLSLYLETGNHRILFDAGQTDAFSENARMLGVDLAQVDLAVLSHGHYDHSGGLLRFLECNETAPVYISPWAFETHYNAEGRDIGVDPRLLHSSRLIRATDGQSIGEGLTLFDCQNRPVHTAIQSAGLSAVVDGALVPEDFRHEQYLLIEEGSRRILISGCSHKGIRNLVRWFQPDVLVGGFHFMKMDPDGADRQALEEAAEELLQYPTTYYTGHCTGEKPFSFLKERMGDRLIRITAGTVLTI